MVKIPCPVDYTIYDGGSVTIQDGKSYAYVLAGNGLFKAVQTAHFDACMCLAPARVAGLPRLEHRFDLHFGRLPGRLLSAILQDARSQSWDRATEAMYHIRIDDGCARAVRPRQNGSGARLSYDGGDSLTIVCDLHSHHEMGAFFSPTDNRDEQGVRFYAVIGRIFTRPEIQVRLGIHGDFWSVPVSSLFDSPGPFQQALGAMNENTKALSRSRR
jgi:PRTRC genetic system protein A